VASGPPATGDAETGRPRPSEEGESRGKTCAGVYRLDAFDRLSVRLGEPGGPRPDGLGGSGPPVLRLTRFDTLSFRDKDK
jgi:hypothetical protein